MSAQYLETRELTLDELTEFPGNPWKGDPEEIAQSLRTHGQYRPLVVRRLDDGSHVIVAGNHTKKGLEILGAASARCEVLRMDDETAVKINVLDNKSKGWGLGFDDEALLALLEPYGENLTGTGYDADDLDDLVSRLRPEETVLQEVGPTEARYAESPEEEAARRERVESYEPRHGGGDMTELILVMTVAQRSEAGQLIAAIRGRDGDDLTAGAVVLYALRNHAGVTGEETGDEETDE